MRQQLADGLIQAGVCGLDSKVIAREVLFLEELLRWNKKINLTSVTDTKMALDRHLIDSLEVFKYIKKNEIVIDIGSGGGLPVIPLAIATPDVMFVSVESTGKKINFQKHIKRLLGLDNLRIVHSRIEDATTAAGLAHVANVVVARALAPLVELIKIAEPLIKPGGRLIAMKGADAQNEVITAKKHLEEAFDDYIEVHNYCLSDQSRRALIVLKKVKL